MSHRSFIRSGLAISFFLDAFLCCNIAYSAPPPPPPVDYVRSIDAITALQAFLGTWEGVETEHTIWGVRTAHIFRCVGRPENRDFLLLALGTSAKFFDVDLITYDPSTLSYNINLVGFRLFTGDHSTNGKHHLGVGNQTTLSWTEPALDGGSRTYNIMLEKGVWREDTEEMDADGKEIGHSEAFLNKTGPTNWSILN